MVRTRRSGASSSRNCAATLVAATGARIAGLVRVDANLAAVFDDAQLERLLSTYRREYPETPEEIEAVRRTHDEVVAAVHKEHA